MATHKAISGREVPEEEAALLIQKSFRGLIGRQAFAHKLILHERGKRKSSRKPAADVQSNQNVPKSTPHNTGDSVAVVQLAKKVIAKPLPQTKLALRNVPARNDTYLDDSLTSFQHQRNLTGITEIDEDIVRDSLSGTKSVAETLLSSKNRSTKPFGSPRESYVRDSLDDSLFQRGRVADDGEDERLEDSLEFRSFMRNLPSGARSSATSESKRDSHSGTMQQKATHLGVDPAVAEPDAGHTIQQRYEAPQFNAQQVCAPSRIPVRSTSQPRGGKRQSATSAVSADGNSQGQAANEQLQKLKQLYELDVRSGMQEQLHRNELDKVNSALVGRSHADDLQGNEARARIALHSYAESDQIANRRAVYGQAQYGQARVAPTSLSREDRTNTDEQHAAQRSDGPSKLELQRRILEQENLLKQKEEEQQQMQRQLEQQQKQHQRQRELEHRRLREQQEREREEQAQHQRLAEEQQARERQAREKRASELQAREQQAREQQAREQQAREQQAREQQAREQQRERQRLRRDRGDEDDVSLPSDIQQQRPQRPQRINPQEQHPSQQQRRLQSQNSEVKHAQQSVQARPDRGHLDSHLGKSSELEQQLLRDLAQLNRQQQKLHNLLDAHQRPSVVESPHESGDSVPEESKIRQHQRAGGRANEGKDKEKDKEKKAFGWGARDFRGKGQVDGNAIKKPSGPNTEAASRPVDEWRAAVRNDSNSQAQGLQKQHHVQAQRAEPQNSCPAQRPPLPDSPNSDKGYEVTHFAQKHYAVLHLEQGAGYLTEFQRKQQHQQQKQLRAGSAPRGGAVSGCDGSVVSADNARPFRKGAGFGIPLPAEQASLSARKANDIESRSLPPIPQASHRRPEPNEAFVHPLGANRRVGSRSSTRSAPS